MRIAMVFEKKAGFDAKDDDPWYRDSELLSDAEEDALLSGLRDAGHEVVRIGDGARLVKRIMYWRNRCDIVLNLSVGYRGIDRKSHVPGVLELASIPYVGSSPYALSLTRHKYHAKLVVRAAGVSTPPAILWLHDESTQLLDTIPYPAIVKPIAESSSIGIERSGSVVSTPVEAAKRARWIVETFKQPSLVETFVRGTEVEVPLMGWPDLRPLGVVGITIDGQIVCGDAHLDSDSIYSDGYGFTTSVSSVDVGAIQATAALAANALGIRDYGRVDLRVGEDGVPYFIEASSTPHIQVHSSFWILARERGLTYPEMLDQIVQVAVQRNRTSSLTTASRNIVAGRL